MSESFYEVGNVVYIVSNRKRQVYPVQITEQVTRKTVEGESVFYTAFVPGMDKIVKLSSIDGEVCISLEQAREYLRGKAMEAIEAVLADAASARDELFPNNSSSPNLQVVQSLPKDREKVAVELPDGTRANVSLPEV